ncbi:MAG: amino acid ABC transporter ATP-binding protein [Eubacterium sp.]
MNKKEKLLEIRNINKDYGNCPVLNGVSLDVHKGEVIVLIGPSGCGKSTFLRCINGLEQIQSGEILLDGEVVTGNKTNWKDVRQKVGMVFQSYDLFPHMTVIDNILLGPVKAQKRDKKEVEKEAEQLLERVGLLEKKNSYPRQLSGGQKQRVAIVRMLIMNPEIMLFDEVTAALDPEMVREVLDVMLELAKQGATMVIVTHEMQFARAVADQVVFLDGGQIVEQSSPDKFFEQPETERARKFLNTFRFEEKAKS